jgi:hypothetical protein
MLGGAVLGALARLCPGPQIVGNLPPCHAADFAPALAGQDQQADDCAVGRPGVAGRAPNLRDFVVGQYALALGNALGDR